MLKEITLYQLLEVSELSTDISTALQTLPGIIGVPRYNSAAEKIELMVQHHESVERRELRVSLHNLTRLQWGSPARVLWADNVMCIYNRIAAKYNESIAASVGVL